MRAYARKQASAAYSIESVGGRIVDKVGAFRSQGNGHLATPGNVNQWKYPRGLKSGLRTYLPEPVKDFMRQWLERRASRK